MTEQRVNLTFRGLNLNAAAPARLLDGTGVGDAGGAFVEHETPLPVGSRLTVRSSDGTGGEKEARVIAVVEQEVGSKAVPGMKIAWVEAVVAPVVTAPVVAAPVVVVEAVVVEPVAVAAAAPEGGEGEAEPAGETQEETAGPTATGDAGGGKRGKRKNRRTLK